MKNYKPVILATQALPITGFVLMSPVLPAVAKEFPDAGSVAIQMMVTLPAVCSLLLGQLSGWLSNFMNKRKLILSGLILFIFGGLGAYFVGEFWQLFLCRILVGVGMGLFVPVNMSLITDFYEGSERTATIGRAQAANYLGGAVATVVAGLLAAASWRNVFLVNMAALFVLLLDFVFLPSRRNAADTVKKRYQILPKAVYLYSLASMAQMLVFYSCVTNFAARAQENGHTGAFSASLGIACLYVGCFLTGAVLVQLKKTFRRWLLEVAVAVMTCGFLLLFCAPQLWTLYLGIFLVGLADGTIIPALMAGAADAAPAAFSGQVMATVNLGTAMGQFAAPVFFAGIKAAAQTETAAGGFRGIFLALSVATIAGAVLTARHDRKATADIK